MYKRTTIITLPLEYEKFEHPDTNEVLSMSLARCLDLNPVKWDNKRIYSDRYFSGDGSIYTFIHIWISREDFNNFSQDTDTIVLTEKRDEWIALNNVLLEVQEEDI